MDNLESLSVKELKELLRDKGLPLVGSKKILIDRLRSSPPKESKKPLNSKKAKETKKKDFELEEIEDYVRYMPVTITGIRENEYIVGTKTQSLGAIVKITEGNVPPNKDALDAIREQPNLWNRFVDKLGSIPFFSSLSNSDREKWLTENEVSSDVYIDEVDGIMIEVIDMGNSDLLKLNEDQIAKLLSGNALPGSEIHKMFPNKPGSKGLKGRVTLIFRRSIWRVTMYDSIVQEYTSVVFDTLTGNVHKEGASVEKDDGSIHLMENLGHKKENSIGIISWKSDDNIEESSLEVIKEFFDVTDNDIKTIETGLSRFTPAGLKSVLQKIIRFRPLFIKFGSIINRQEISSEIVLFVTLRKLMLSSGSFVPDIQRFVSGMESAFKRLIVTLFEDSIITEENIDIALGIMSCALLAQRIKNWKPNRDILRNFFTLALAGIDSNTAFLFDIGRGLKRTPYDLEKSTSSVEYISSFLDEMRSFEGDLGMVRDIATHFPSIGDSSDERPEIMPIEHSIDQHWAPEVVFFYTHDTIHSQKRAGSKPFAGLMMNIFSEVTGVNPRREGRKRRTGTNIHPYDVDFEDRPFVIETRQAQKLLLKAKQKSYRPKREKLDGEFIYNYTLDRSWLAGLLGSISLKISNMSVIVTLDPNELEELVVIKKPSRDSPKDPDDNKVPEHIKEIAIDTVRGMLQRGHKLRNTTFGGSKVFMRNNIYYIDNEEWDSFRTNRTEIIPFIEDIPDSDSHFQELNIALENSLLTEGIVRDPYQKVMELLERSDPMEVRRMATYLSSKEIRVNPLSRDGGGSKNAVLIEDAGCFQLLLKLSSLCPHVLHREPHTLFFVAPLQPLLVMLKEWVMDYINKIPLEGLIDAPDIGEWPKLIDEDARELWEHQIHAVDEMLEAHDAGRNGHFLWANTGLGKTLIVLTYLSKLQERGKLPPYIIYTLPPEALTSIKRELELFGLTVELLIPLKNVDKKYRNGGFTINHGTIPNRFVVTLILHDHIKIIDSLVTLMPQTILIIDEVHNCLRQSLRTEATLNLSNLSQEFIALTATPVIDNDIYKLIWWLKRVVPFEVDSNTFWVAVNAMVSKIVKTNVEVERDEIHIDMDDDDIDEYRKLVPPSLGGTNKNPRPSDFSEAMNICYKTCTKAMIDVAIQNKDFGVFLVARNIQHQQEMLGMLIDGGIDQDDIFLIEKGSSIVLNDKLVNEGKVHDYKFVITTLSRSAGYTLSRLQMMITCVYPSNNAIRTQLDGRINRLDQYAERIYYLVFHTGILTNILERHNGAKSLEMAIKALSEEVGIQKE